jgi:type I restriction enzyme S subunit
LRNVSSKEENHNFIPDDLSTYRVVRSGDLVINKMKAWSGSLGVAPCDGIVSPAYFVFDLAIEDARFAHYLLRSRPLVNEFARCSGGVRVGQWDLSLAAMKAVEVHVPEGEEQKLIVRYLDNAEMRIAKAIAGKNEVLVTLREAKTAVISELVLGESSDRVETGVPGIGAAPRHWRRRRAKYIWRSVDVRSTTGSEERLTVSSARGIVPRSSATVTMFEAASYIGHKLVEPGNLVINSLWSWANGLGVSKHRGIVSPVYGVYELTDEECDVAYLDHLLRSNVCQWQFQVRSKGIWKSRLSLTDEAFLDMLLVLPPLEEQQAIASKINERTAAIDTAMAAIENEIALLKEYRVRLISDVVTGKLDVRAEAANLPEVDPSELAAVLAGGTASTDEEEGADGDD